MVVQKLIAWRGARGDDGSIPVKDAIEGVFAEVAPLSFVVEVSDDAEVKNYEYRFRVKRIEWCRCNGPNDIVD